MSLSGTLRAYLHRRRRQALGRYLDPVRRLERVAPVPGRRLVAMTFDDGPSAAPLNPGPPAGLTETLLDILARYQARGTFDVIGTTEHNYPDREGRLGTPQWSGVRHDHYPAFGQDHLAGLKNQPALARRLAAAGHELANHGYRHVAFGPGQLAYRGRAHLPDLAAVVADLEELDRLAHELTGQRMRLGRPPHYIDRTADGASAYTAYRRLGYLYLAASFDGGGWQPSGGDYQKDVEAMVAPLARALAGNPEALNGQIIFQKDGFNMSKQTPVVDALPRHLELLAQHGYRVVTVSELLEESPFADLGPGHPTWAAAKACLEAGYAVAYRDNTVQPARVLTRGELAALLAPRQAWLEEAPESPFTDLPPRHPYLGPALAASQAGWLQPAGGRFRPEEPVSGREFWRALEAHARHGTPPAKDLGAAASLTHGQALEALAPNRSTLPPGSGPR